MKPLLLALALFAALMPGRTNADQPTYDFDFVSPLFGPPTGIAAAFAPVVNATGQNLVVDQVNNNSPYAVTVSDTFNSVTVGNPGTGVLNHSDGVLTVGGFLYVGSNNVGNNGTYNLSGTGSLVVNNQAFIGTAGTGVFNQTGGSFTTNNNALSIGRSAGSNGSYTLGGTSSLSTGFVYLGSAGAGVFTQNAGTFSTNGRTLYLADDGGGNATYNLNGGILTTGQVLGNGNNSFSTFNFNGGTLQVTNSATNFFQGLTTANVRNGGAIVDTRGQNATISQSLVHSTISGDAPKDGGLTKINPGILTLAAANTYTGATLVNGGTLSISVNGGLAKGDVSIAAGATLSLGTGVKAAHNASTGTTLTLADLTTSVFNMADTGVQDTVGTLIVNGVAQPAGTYGAVGSGAMYTTIADFTGTGVLSVIPEPSTWTLLGVGAAGLPIALRRRSRAQLAA